MSPIMGSEYAPFSCLRQPGACKYSDARAIKWSKWKFAEDKSRGESQQERGEIHLFGILREMKVSTILGMAFALSLDSMILEVHSNLNGSVILWF